MNFSLNLRQTKYISETKQAIYNTDISHYDCFQLICINTIINKI